MVACFFAGCSEGDEPVAPNKNPEVNTPAITLDSSIQTSGLSFDTSTSEKSITFTSATDWTLSIAETRSGTSWCTASPTSGGKGTATVKFTTTENTEPEDRSVAVTIKAGTTSKTFTVTQKGNKSLLVTTKKYELPKEGGEIEIEVKSNIEYEMEISETAKDWISENSGRAITTHKHIFNITASEEATKREGEIIFKSGDIVEIVKVYQAGEPTIVLSKNEFTVSDAGETISIDIKSNVDFDVKMPDVDWITEEPASRAMSSHTLKYIVSPNETYEERSAKLVFCDKNSELKDTLTIIQVQKDALFLSQKTITARRGGETIEIKLLANVDIEVSIPETDWIKQVESRSLKEACLYFEIAENKTNESRSVNIAITDKAKELSDTITVVQGEAVEMVVMTNAQAGDLDGQILSAYQGLKLIGDLNGSDIRALQFASNLKVLDLSEANIVEGGDYYTQNGNDKYYTKNNVIGPHFFRSSIEEIVLPNNVNVIDDYAFSYCRKLKSLIIPEGVVAIGNNAFEGCHSLNSLVIPNSVKTIGQESFTYSGIQTITLPSSINSISKGMFSHSSLKNIKVPEGVISIEESAFYWCTGLTNVILPKSLITIGNKAFSNCNDLANINLPDNLNSIGEFAFSNCYRNFKKIDLPNSLETIGKGAFSSCFSLESIKIPQSVSVIDTTTFSSCEKLSSVDLHNKITIIKASAFGQCTNLKSIEIPASVTTIEQSAFAYCSTLTTINIPSSITSIHKQAFSYCTGLNSITVDADNSVYDSRNNCNAIIEKSTNRLVLGCANTTIPETVYIIGENSFANCVKLISIEIPNSVTTIEKYAFSSCKDLSTISFPKGLSIFGQSAFSGCMNLTSITSYNENPTIIGNDVFPTKDNVILYVPKGTKNKYKKTDGWAGFKAILDIGQSETDIPKANYELQTLTIKEAGSLINENIEHFKNIKLIGDLNGTDIFVLRNWKGESLDLSEAKIVAGGDAYYNTTEGACYTKENVLGYNFFPKTLTQIKLPENIVSIDGAFNGCSELLELIIPNSVTSIGQMAFSGCSNLKELSIPNSVTFIDQYAFYRCSGLTSITLPEILNCPIGACTFMDCSNLTSIKIPEGVTSIKNSAFSGCTSLTNINIPNSVTEIISSAFWGCENLTYLYCYPQTPITIDNFTFSDSKNCTLYVPKGAKDNYKYATGWSEFKEIIEMAE